MRVGCPEATLPPKVGRAPSCGLPIEDLSGGDIGAAVQTKAIATSDPLSVLVQLDDEVKHLTASTISQ